MNVFDSIDFSGHEQVVYVADPVSGLRGIIAVHSTASDPAIGGGRMPPYRDETPALLRALGTAADRFGGRCIADEDVDATAEDIAQARLDAARKQAA